MVYVIIFKSTVKTKTKNNDKFSKHPLHIVVFNHILFHNRCAINSNQNIY